MALALGILGAVYIAAMVVLGGLLRDALRRSPSSGESDSSGSKVIPIRRGSGPSASAGVRDS
jgi:hypothetical protein